MVVFLGRYKAAVRAFVADTSGVILPYVTVMLVVIVGISALAVDGSRFTGLHTHLQNGADAIALAGAFELDRLPDSIVRADNAINELIANKFNVGAGEQTITLLERTFYRRLPASDATPLPGDGEVTTDPIQAQYVAVTVAPVTMPTIMPIAFFVPGGTNSVTTRATAVAGNNRVSCGITPMFICNPFEQSGDTYAQATARLQAADNDDSFKRRLIRLEDAGPSGTWGPGSFGYLVPDAGTLADDTCFASAGSGIGPAMAAARPKLCFVQNGVDLQPGNTQVALKGLNTRFGLYESPGNTPACMAAYPPDVNVRKGYEPHASGDWCRGDPNGAYVGEGIEWPSPGVTGENHALPLDQSETGNIGNGIWDCLDYWQGNYGTIASPAGCTNTAQITRRSVYDYEIATSGLLGTASGAPGETGTPQCSPATKQAERRVLFVAIVNCGSSPVSITSNATGVPVAGVGKFFLTIPSPHESVKPRAEFMGLVTQGDGVNFDQVQLYR